jgi:replicative DNA helicase
MANEARSIPCNLEAEQAVLGALLLDNSALARVAGTITADDFYEPTHARIFAAIASFISEGKRANPVTIKAALHNYDMGGLTVAEYVARLAASAVTVSGAADYAKAIADASARRAVIAIADEAKARAMVADVEDPPSRIIDQTMAGLSSIGVDGKQQTRETISVGTAAEDYLKRAQEIAAGRQKVDLIRTGIGPLDQVLGGIGRGNLVIVAGRPGQGKSALALQIAMNISRSAPVLYLSLEMTNDEFAQRALSSLAYHPSWKPLGFAALRDPSHLSNEDLSRLANSEKRLRSHGLLLHDEPGVSIEQVALRISMTASRLSTQGKRLSAVVVDHLGLIRRPRHIASTVHQIEAITNGLKEMAKRIDAPIFALSQLNRAVEQRDDKRPQLSDLRDSGSIEQDADAVIGVYRDSYYAERGMWVATDVRPAPAGPNSMEAIVLKNRHGLSGAAHLFCDMAHNVIAGDMP